jgi:hypothetical protein
MIETQLPRKFNKVEIAQTKDLMNFMKPAFDAQSWNHLRQQAKDIWSEKIITAIDGIRKWAITYDKSTKTCICNGVKF